MRIFFLLLIFHLIISGICFPQKGTTTIGLQLKPIFPFSFLGTGKIINDTAGVRFETGLTSGYNFGLIIRHNFTKLVAVETGISYLKRKYNLSISEKDFQDNSSFRIISYEIPVVFMMYSQIGEKIYINGSLGPALDMFASSIETLNENFHHVAFLNHIFQPAITANLGFEYRTDKSGTFYLGGSFVRPFDYIYLSKVGYYRNHKDLIVENELSGSYVTIDIRFFFPADNRKIPVE